MTTTDTPTRQQITAAYDHMFPENIDPGIDDASARWLYESRWANATQLAAKWLRESYPSPTEWRAPSPMRRPRMIGVQPYYSRRCTAGCCKFGL